jgi:hypothetical protein
MPSPYFTTIAPYFAQQDQGLSPVFQNIAQQQQNQNAALQQQMQNNQMAGQTQGGGMSGLNPLAMAAMLRNKKPNYDQWQTSGDNTYFGENSNGMGAGQNYSGMNAELGL